MKRKIKLHAMLLAFMLVGAYSLAPITQAISFGSDPTTRNGCARITQWH